MAPHTIPFPARTGGQIVGANANHDPHHLVLNAEDGTIHLLRSGFLIAGMAALCICLTLWVLGGIGPDGPHTQMGWLALMIALMCMPFGLLLLLLGGAKWLRNHALSRQAARSRPADFDRIPTKHPR